MSSSNLETNKIFAAVLVAGIVAMLAGFIASMLVPEETPEEDAFPVQVAESGADGAAAVAEAAVEPIDDLLAAADPAMGEKLTKACQACHSFDQGGPHKIGPNLWGVYGAKHGGKDYPYSPAMQAAEGTWDVAHLNEFLWKPKKTVPGTKMNFPGIAKAEDRAAVVKYLQTLK